MSNGKYIKYRIKHLIALKKARVLTRFVHNCETYRHCKSDVGLIGGAFIWMDTKQGSQFWNAKIRLAKNLRQNTGSSKHVTIKEFRTLNRTGNILIQG